MKMKAAMLDAKRASPGVKVPGGIVLKESAVFAGDYATRPYAVRLVVREHPYHPFVVWVYFLDGTDRAHGCYCETLEAGLEAFATKCDAWGVAS